MGARVAAKAHVDVNKVPSSLCQYCAHVRSCSCDLTVGVGRVGFFRDDATECTNDSTADSVTAFADDSRTQY